MTFRVTAIRPSDEYIAPLEAYLALAEAMHDESYLCNANYAIPFDECGAKEADIGDAVRVLADLHRAGWHLTHDPAGTVEMGL
jgi:hypothetical protein